MAPLIPITEFSGTLVKKKMLTEDVMFLSFSVAERFMFSAGQYIIIKIENQGVMRLKSYSILNPPSQKGKIDLCVKIIEQGFASEVFHAAVLGQQFQFRGPFGHFSYDEAATDHWFVCAGTGITPLYSMILENITKYPHSSFTLLFGVRERKNLFLHDELREVERQHQNFTFVPVLSREIWEGKKGRVQLFLPENMQEKTFYICGLKELVLETKELLLSKGVQPERIRIERYT